jgi:AcrR family transcriptional regulator
MSSRGDETRERLLDTAERLLADHGVFGVSLREIRIAAGARNTAAMQFHFGNREGLLLALTQRHLPRIAAIQDRLYEAVVSEGRDDDPRSLVAVLVCPAAEYAREGTSARAWIKIMSNLASAADLHLTEFVSAAPPTSVAVGNLLFTLLVAQMPRGVATERLFAVARSATHIVADQARLVDDPTARRPIVDDEVFVENLVDMAHGALFAPVSTALIDRL